LSRAKPNGFGAGTRARAARATSRPVATARRRTKSYTHADAGPCPEVLVSCSVVPVHDVGGSYAEPRGACALATPRLLNAAIGRPAAARRRRSLPMPFELMPSRRCSRQWCPRRAPPSSHLHRQRGLPRPALGPLVASRVTCCSGQTPSLSVSELPRPPPGHLHRACTSACSPSQWAHVASPLHTEVLCVAYCSVEPFPSSDFAPPRLCCPATAAARRRPLRPSYRRQSLSGEPNRFPRRSFAYPCTPSPPVSLSSSSSVQGGGK
jgi:hypothetical protein